MKRIQGFKDSSEMLKNYKELKVWQRSYSKGSRIQGVKDSSEMLKNYKDLKVWQRSYSKGSRGQGFKWLSSVHLNPSTLESLNPFFYILPMDQTVNWKRR